MTENMHNGSSCSQATSNEANSQDTRTPSAAAAASETSDVQNILEPCSSFRNLDSKEILFCGCGLALTSCIWLGTVISFYVVSAQTNSNVFYESRWLLSAALIAGVCALCLYMYKLKTLYLASMVAICYALPSSMVTLLTYSMNLHRILRGGDFQTTVSSTVPLKSSRKQYIQLCFCLIIVSLFSFGLLTFLAKKLHKIGLWYFKVLSIPSRVSKILFTIGCLEVCLSLFSVYVTTRIIAVRASHVHTYMIQELHCSLVLLLVAVFQICLSFRATEVLLKSLVILLVAQFIQELFYTWNAYYMALYLHASKVHVAISLQVDQGVMTANFVNHFLRMTSTAYTCLQLCPFIAFACSKLSVDFNKNVQQFLSICSGLFFLLGACHVTQDIMYTLMEHVYRTLVAFTGVSVFYATVVGLSLSMFVRSRLTIYLIISSFFVTLLFFISVHGVYVYLDSTFTRNLIRNLEALEKDTIKPSLMHFVEGLMALLGFVLSTVTGFAMYRLLRMGSEHINYYKLGFCIRALLYQGIAIIVLTSMEIILMFFVRDHWRLFDTTLAYNVMDVLSMLGTGALQIYVSSPTNRHSSFHLVVLFLVLMAELLTTFNYLNTYTTYIQLLIMLHRLMGDHGGVGQSKIISMFTTSHIAPLVVNHALQVVQWLITVTSLITCAVSLERLYDTEDTTTNAASASGDGSSSAISTIAARVSAEANLNASGCPMAFENPSMVGVSDECPLTESA